jgi:outer membrane protein assembly factor BamD (BamD/ComL family)
MIDPTFFMISLRSTLFSLLIALFASTAVAQEEAYTETFDNQRKFFFFGGPSKKGPEDQWQRIQGLIKREKNKSAIKQAGYLVQTWPDHPLAVDAQRLRADLYFSREEYKLAFDAYQGLIDDFAGLFDYNAVLTQQLECARNLEKKKYSALFGLSVYTQPLEAIRLYEQILVNAPHIQDAPEILYTMGNIYMRQSKHLEAIKEFDALEQQFPNSPFSELAALERAQAYQKRAKRYPTDLRPVEAEQQALDHFIATYPNSERLAEVRLRLKIVYDYLAKARYEKGFFYENTLNKPDAALTIYQTVVKQYPDSEWTPKAKTRILGLTSPPTSP